jgi:hypothetical protein
MCPKCEKKNEFYEISEIVRKRIIDNGNPMILMVDHNVCKRYCYIEVSSLIKMGFFTDHLV